MLDKKRERRPSRAIKGHKRPTNLGSRPSAKETPKKELTLTKLRTNVGGLVSRFNPAIKFLLHNLENLLTVLGARLLLLLVLGRLISRLGLLLLLLRLLLLGIHFGLLRGLAIRTEPQKRLTPIRTYFPPPALSRPREWAALICHNKRGDKKSLKFTLLLSP